MKEKHVDQTFEITDLGAASALLATGFSLLKLDPGIGKRVVFVFLHKPGIEQAVNDYWSGRLSVDALGFFTSQKILKSRIYGTNF